MAKSVNLFVLNWNGRDLILDCLYSLEKVTYPNVKIYDHDVDSNPNFGTTLGTKGLPTFYCFVDGELKGQLVGSVPESKFAEFVAQHSS